jgi:(p)ppGpp synthase/HD superfamily hydrolase
MNHWNPDKIERAWAFATRQHQGQTYGGQAEGERVEYMTHIGSVMMEASWALQADGTADGDLALQCAVLHDTLEDTGATFEDLETRFGHPVAQGVLALSKDATLPDKASQMQDSLRRIQRQPREVWMVKLADRIANLQAPPFYWKNEKILSYQDESRLIHRTLGAASDKLASRLAEKISAYSGFLRP